MDLPMSNYLTAALYKFVSLPDYAELQQPLLDKCNALGIKGTLLLAEEGINGTVAGLPDDIRALLEYLRSDPRLAALEQGFHRVEVSGAAVCATAGFVEKQVAQPKAKGSDGNAKGNEG